MKESRADPKRRVLALFAFMFLAFLIVEARLWYLQVWLGDFYELKALQTRRTKETVEAPRGKIADRNGAVLAEDILTFDAFADRRVDNLATGFGNLLALLRRHGKADPKLPEPDPEREEWQEWEEWEEWEKDPLKLVAHSVGYDIAEQVAVRQKDFPGIIVKIGSKRHYPEGDRACQVVGYVGPMREGEPKKLIPLGYRLSDNLGRAGVEMVQENALRGKRGGRVVERNYKQGSEDVLLEVASKAGAEIRLNLDLCLQAVAEKELGERPAAAVLMNVNDGAVIVMASRPGYDPAAFSPPRDNKRVKALFEDPNKPLINRVTQGCYPLGSVFKLVTAVAGMETGTITRDATFGCIGFHEVGGRAFKCWRKSGHGELKLEQAIQQSCNVFFYKLAEKMGPRPIVAWGKRLGYGSKTGVDIPHERPGLLPAPENTGRHWSGGDTLNLCIGQGSVMVTPLQVARCVAAIANGGYLVSPRVMESTPVVRKKIEIRSRTLDVVRKGMWMVVNTPWGTGAAACQRNVDLAGKTATAEVQGKKDHAWFVAYGPYRKPEVCIVVIIEHGGKGGAVAAPVAGEIMKEVFNGVLPNRNDGPVG